MRTMPAIASCRWINKIPSSLFSLAILLPQFPHRRSLRMLRTEEGSKCHQDGTKRHEDTENSVQTDAEISVFLVSDQNGISSRCDREYDEKKQSRSRPQSGCQFFTPAFKCGRAIPCD